MFPDTSPAMTQLATMMAEQIYLRVDNVVIEKNARYEVVQTTEARKQIWLDELQAALTQLLMRIQELESSVENLYTVHKEESDARCRALEVEKDRLEHSLASCEAQHDRLMEERAVLQALYVEHRPSCTRMTVHGYDPERGYIVRDGKEPIYRKELPACTCGLDDLLTPTRTG